MAAEFDRIVAKIEADTSEFLSELKKAAGAAEDFGKKSGGALGSIRAAITNTAKQLTGFRAAMAAAAGATGLLYFTNRAVESADALAKTAERLDVTTTKLQELRYAASRTGASAEAMDVGLRFLSRSLGEAARGSGENRELLLSLGLVGKDVGSAFEGLSDVFARSTDAQAKNALAMQLLGRGGSQLINTMNLGSEGIDQLAQKARSLGLVLDEATVRKAEAANNELADMFDIFKKLGLSIAFEFLPAFREVARTVASPEFVASIKSFGHDLGSLIKVIADNGDAVVRVMGALVGISILGRLGPIGAGVGALVGAVGPELAELIIGLDKTRGKIEEVGVAEKDTTTKTKELEDELSHLLLTQQYGIKTLNDQNEVLKRWLDLAKAAPDSLVELDQATQILTESVEKNINATTKAGQAWKDAKILGAQLAQLQTDVRAAIEGTRTEQEKMNLELERLKELRPHLPLEVYQRRLEQIIPELRRLQEAAEEMGKTIASSFEDAIFEGKKLGDVLTSLANDLARIMFRKTVTEPLADALSLGFKGVFSSLTPSAKGNVFSGPVMPFARGGVVSSPRVFPMARGVGLMGESGPEAIIPLRRTRGGDLGVQASGMGRGSSVEVNVYAPPGSSAREERSGGNDLERVNIFIDGAVADNMRPGTKTFRALTRTFGLQQQGINR